MEAYCTFILSWCFITWIVLITGIIKTSMKITLVGQFMGVATLLLALPIYHFLWA